VAGRIWWQLVAETAVDMANDKGRGLDAMMLEAAFKVPANSCSGSN
jgi:hypothetical protein